jgi:hypothetical protein
MATENGVDNVIGIFHRVIKVLDKRDSKVFQLPLQSLFRAVRIKLQLRQYIIKIAF